MDIIFIWTNLSNQKQLNAYIDFSILFNNYKTQIRKRNNSGSVYPSDWSPTKPERKVTYGALENSALLTGWNELVLSRDRSANTMLPCYSHQGFCINFSPNLKPSCIPTLDQQLFHTCWTSNRAPLDIEFPRVFSLLRYLNNQKTNEDTFIPFFMTPFLFTS